MLSFTTRAPWVHDPKSRMPALGRLRLSAPRRVGHLATTPTGVGGDAGPVRRRCPAAAMMPRHGDARHGCSVAAVFLTRPCSFWGRPST